MRHALVAAALLALAGDATAQAREMRGLWVVRTALVSPESVDRVVELARAGGFNALFVQVRGRGDAFYDSSLVSRSVLLERQPASFDPLARLLERARSSGLEVHGWFNVLLTAHFPTRLPAGHVLSRHPEWVMVPREIARAARRAQGARLLGLVREASRDDPDAEGYYLSPSSPGVAAHLEGAVRELAQRYPLDGLHWDFIRYPGPRYDYSRWALEGFREWRGGGDVFRGPAESPDAWATYRRGVLNSLARRLGEAAREVRPGVVISAAVVPDEAAAVHHKFQAWPAWVDRGILDVICPMAYTTSPEVFRRQVAHAQMRAGSAGRVWAGIGAYRLPIEDSIDRIRTVRRMGAQGVVLYSHESFSPGDLPPLRQAFGSAEVAVELSGPGALRGAASGR